MSFLKKMQKVLSLLGFWGNEKPIRKLRKRTRVKRSAKKKAVKKKILKVTKKAALTKKVKGSLNKGVKNKLVSKKRISRAIKRITKPTTLPVKMTPKTPTKPAKLKRVLVGEVTHYFDRASVAAFMVTGAPIILGDALEFEGKWGVFRQEIKSLQMNRVPVKSARAGDEVGILVKKPVKEGDYVFKVL